MYSRNVHSEVSRARKRRLHCSGYDDVNNYRPDTFACSGNQVQEYRYSVKGRLHDRGIGTSNGGKRADEAPDNGYSSSCVSHFFRCLRPSRQPSVTPEVRRDQTHRRQVEHVTHCGDGYIRTDTACGLIRLLYCRG
jgi:hypothetical protein